MSILDILEALVDLDRITIKSKGTYRDIIIQVASILMLLGCIYLVVLMPEMSLFAGNVWLEIALGLIASIVICYFLHKLNVLVHLQVFTMLFFFIMLSTFLFCTLHYINL